MKPMKKITILGSTGSIGINTLKVISRYHTKFSVQALTCGSNVDLLARQAKIFRPKALGVRDMSKVKKLKEKVKGLNARIFAGAQGIEEIARNVKADTVVMAISGNASLLPLIGAIEQKDKVLIASKEPLVSAGGIIMDLAKKKNCKIIPLDSEHNAIFQCLKGHDIKELKNIYLTGSGGPLRLVKHSLFSRLSIKKVLAHPKWKMGKKISVDSATLMNKGLEVIEARWLFDMPLKRIKVLIHPEAIVHSMIEFVDGAFLAQLGMPDMRLPIQYALDFPRRLKSNKFNVDFSALRALTFYNPDHNRFPCLGLAYEALKRGGSAPCVLNAANEEAVGMFLKKRIGFTAIPKIIEKVMNLHKIIKSPELNDIISADKWARREASHTCHSGFRAVFTARKPESQEVAK